MKLWSWLREQWAAMPPGPEADVVAALLAEHIGRSPDDESCAGCGFSTALANGYLVPRTMTLDACPTLRALAWRWHDQPGWRREWALPLGVPVTSWPPSENCYCQGTAGAHRRGTRRRCRPSRATRRWEQRTGVA